MAGREVDIEDAVCPGAGDYRYYVMSVVGHSLVTGIMVTVDMRFKHGGAAGHYTAAKAAAGQHFAAGFYKSGAKAGAGGYL